MMTDMIAQVKEAEERANLLWQERYGNQDEKPTQEQPAIDAQAPQDTQPEPQRETQQEDFEHKYSVLKGKYDKEVPAMAYQLAEQLKKITELEQKIGELTGSMGGKKEPSEPPVENEKLLSFKAEYPEVYEGIVEIGRSMISELKNELEPKISRVDQEFVKIKEEDSKKAKERFKASLDNDQEIGKDWRTINQDPDFIESLQEIEPYSGRRKHDLLLDAWNSMDIERTARFFKDWKKRAGGSSHPSKPERRIDSSEVHPPKGSRGSNIDNRDTTTPTTRGDLQEFYKDVALGRWKGREKEAEAEERRILMGLGIKVR